MKSHEKSSGTTRQRLLRYACEVFAAKGFRDATIAEICRRAGANIAAVNYHFGNKEHLYAEAWRHSFDLSLQAHPPDGGVSTEAPPEQKLRARVTALLRRIADERSSAFAMLCTELANPTGLLVEPIKEAVRPLRREMAGIVRQLLGPDATDAQVRFCQMSILSQCMDPMFKRRVMKQSGAGWTLTPDRVEAFADHVVTFSLAGISAIRKQANSAGQRRKNK